MQANVQEFLEVLPELKEDLPFSPELFQKLFQQTGQDSNASMDDIAETISFDQGLTARILSLANSAYYGLQAEVSSVQRAAAVLGLCEIRNIVMTIGVTSLAEKYEVPKQFSLRDYWTHQFLTADQARHISKSLGKGVPDTLFTAGLLHDIGKLITALKRPVDWQVMAETAVTKGIPDYKAEDGYWGMDHAVIGALVLKYWDLPPELVEPVNWHHAPKLAGDYRYEAAILCLSDAVAHVTLDADHPLNAVTAKVAPQLGLQQDALIERATEQMESGEADHFARMAA
ncbi:HDOD domain-containing protein [Salidesulfovibrio brasiliensis]|uniref:HDOD domain-containing protein n=1 Tax=Salidesulfovibrio brasiliensis TaxID=221711 RepID=UPI0006D0B346|nr:HDOD domain-containing protein [Salidesulfovibrio brasiliensis]